MLNRTAADERKSRAGEELRLRARREELYRELVASKEFVLSKQMLRAGTAIGANVEEAPAGQTRRDFAAKMAIASKEARECHCWLRLLKDSALSPAARAEPLIADCLELIRLLTAIVKTAQIRG